MLLGILFPVVVKHRSDWKASRRFSVRVYDLSVLVNVGDDHTFLIADRLLVNRSEILRSFLETLTKAQLHWHLFVDSVILW